MVRTTMHHKHLAVALCAVLLIPVACSKPDEAADGAASTPGMYSDADSLAALQAWPSANATGKHGGDHGAVLGIGKQCDYEGTGGGGWKQGFCSFPAPAALVLGGGMGSGLV